MTIFTGTVELHNNNGVESSGEQKIMKGEKKIVKFY